MSLVLNSDFTGKYALSLTQYNTSVLDAYIEKYTKRYLLKLLGAELYDLFIADLDASTPQVPQTAPYTTIFNEFHLNINGELVVSNGIVEMLKGFIYYEYSKDIAQVQTPIGNVQPSGENGLTTGVNMTLTTRYNEAVDTFKAIQEYIEYNIQDFATYNGVEAKYNYFFN